MIRLNRIGTKIILAIGVIWFPFLLGTIWYDMKEARKLALQEVERWGVASGESVRIALNALMREGKMESRFAFFNDLTSEITGLKSVRVIRSPRVNEIFREVREKRDIPREEEEINVNRERIAELAATLEQTRDEYERSDIVAEIAQLNNQINRSEERILKFNAPMIIDARELARDDIDRQVLETGTAVMVSTGDLVRMVAPYKARKVGCSQAGGCHLYAKEGDVLGAIDMVFSLESMNQELRNSTIFGIFGKVIVSLIILALIYMAVNLIVIRKFTNLRSVMESISTGNAVTSGDPAAGPSAQTDNEQNTQALMSAEGDEFDYLLSGVNSMAGRLKDNQSELERLATYDSLTELYNRRKFTSALRDEIIRYKRHTRPLSLLMIDLDHFKDINDTHGHQGGDEALRIVGRTVNAEIRRSDIAARYGGEEIAVILPETSNHDAMALAERIRNAIGNEHIEIEPGRIIQLTASIGVATLSPGTELEVDDQLVRTADAALYIAKRDGRNCVRNAHGGHDSPPAIASMHAARS